MIHSIPPRHTPGKDSVAYWENFLTPQEIEKIILLPHWNSVYPAKVGGNDSVNKNIRVSDVAWVGNDPEIAGIWAKITDTLSIVNSQFFRFDLTGCYEPMQLGIYRAEDSGYYTWHTDASITDTKVPRKLSMVLMLSDSSEYEGGELQVKIEGDHAKTLETKKGRAWFFPSYVLHRVTPVTKGVRKSLVLWAGGPEFR